MALSSAHNVMARLMLLTPLAIHSLFISYSLDTHNLSCNDMQQAQFQSVSTFTELPHERILTRTTASPWCKQVPKIQELLRLVFYTTNHTLETT